MTWEATLGFTGAAASPLSAIASKNFRTGDVLVRSALQLRTGCGRGRPRSGHSAFERVLVTVISKADGSARAHSGSNWAQVFCPSAELTLAAHQASLGRHDYLVAGPGLEFGHLLFQFARAAD